MDLLRAALREKRLVTCEDILEDYLQGHTLEETLKYVQVPIVFENGDLQRLFEELSLELFDEEKKLAAGEVKSFIVPDIREFDHLHFEDLFQRKTSDWVKSQFDEPEPLRGLYHSKPFVQRTL